MEPAALLQAIGALLQDQPDANDTNELSRWIGRAEALVSKVNQVWAREIQVSASTSIVVAPSMALDQVNLVLHRALAAVELDAPVQQQGTFIQAGNDLDALAGASKVLKTATSSVLIVDPYMDEVVLTDYAVLARERVALKLLADERTVKPSFEPAVRRFHAQFGSLRPLEARLTAAGNLHDRLILIDDQDVFTVTQSLKDLAKRSHASIIKADPELAGLKVSAYAQLWQDSNALL